MLSFLLFLKTDVRKNNHSCWRTSSKEAWVIISSHFIERLIASSSMLHDSLNVLVKWSTVPGIMRSLSIMAISRGPVFFQADALSTIYDISLCNARFARANFPFGLHWWGKPFGPDGKDPFALTPFSIWLSGEACTQQIRTMLELLSIWWKPHHHKVLDTLSLPGVCYKCMNDPAGAAGQYFGGLRRK